MTASELAKIKARLPLSQSTLARNLPAVDPVAGSEREPDPEAALAHDLPKQPRRQGRLAVVVTIISARHRLCDDDNSAMGGNKALRDAIARSLAIDDGDPRIRFSYGQIHTDGPEGTLVMIQRLPQ